jgi:hypothetical protein
MGYTAFFLVMLVLLVGATKKLAVKVGICSDPGPNVIKKLRS